MGFIWQLFFRVQKYQNENKSEHLTLSPFFIVFGFFSTIPESFSSVSILTKIPIQTLII